MEQESPRRFEPRNDAEKALFDAIEVLGPKSGELVVIRAREYEKMLLAGEALVAWLQGQGIFTIVMVTNLETGIERMNRDALLTLIQEMDAKGDIGDGFVPIGEGH